MLSYSMLNEDSKDLESFKEHLSALVNLIEAYKIPASYTQQLLLSSKFFATKNNGIKLFTLILKIFERANILVESKERDEVLYKLLQISNSDLKPLHNIVKELRKVNKLNFHNLNLLFRIPHLKHAANWVHNSESSQMKINMDSVISQNISEADIKKILCELMWEIADELSKINLDRIAHFNFLLTRQLSRANENIQLINIHTIAKELSLNPNKAMLIFADKNHSLFNNLAKMLTIILKNNIVGLTIETFNNKLFSQIFFKLFTTHHKALLDAIDQLDLFGLLRGNEGKINLNRLLDSLQDYPFLTIDILNYIKRKVTCQKEFDLVFKLANNSSTIDFNNALILLTQMTKQNKIIKDCAAHIAGFFAFKKMDVGYVEAVTRKTISASKVRANK